MGPAGGEPQRRIQPGERENPNEAVTTHSIPARNGGEGGLQRGGEDGQVEKGKGMEDWGGEGGGWKKGTKNKGARKMEGKQWRKSKKREGLERRKTERKAD